MIGCLKKIGVVVAVASPALLAGCISVSTDTSASIAATRPATVIDRASDLHQTLLALDRQLFDAVFVSCDRDAIRLLMAPDLEFYHDKSGQTADSLETFLSRPMPGCADSPPVRRVLLPDTVEVRVLKDYGAMQTGTHEFRGAVDGVDTLFETAQFIHLWKETPDGWQITRVISYDHLSPR